MQKNNISFDGNPFTLEETEGFFKQLKNAGETSVILVVTWQAIEHEGTGIYDEAYLAYLRKILLIADKEGFSVYIKTHKDLQTEIDADGLTAQYASAFKHAQRRIKNCKAVAGWSSANEPLCKKLPDCIKLFVCNDDNGFAMVKLNL